MSELIVMTIGIVISGVGGFIFGYVAMEIFLKYFFK